MTWDTTKVTLDPNLTLVALRARAHPQAHYVQVRAWEAKRRTERLLATATLWVVVALVVSALGWWLR